MLFNRILLLSLLCGITFSAVAQSDSVESCVKLAKFHLRNHAYDSALIFARRADQMMTEADTNYPHVHYVLSVAYHKIGLSDRAIDEILVSIRQAEQQGDSVLLGQVYIHLGILYNRLEDTTRAMLYLHRARTIAERIGKPKMQVDAIGNLAETYKLKGDNTRYYEWLVKALSISRELKDTLFVGYYYNNLAGFFMEVERLDSAGIYYRRAIHIEHKLGIYSGIAMGNLGEVFRRQGVMDSALYYIDSAIGISVRNGDLRTMAHNYTNMAKCYASVLQFDKAYENLLLARRLTDSSTNEMMLSRIQALSIAFETERKEQENALLSADNRVRLSELKTSRRTNTALILGLILTLGFTALFLFQKRRINKAYRALVMKNLEVVRAEQGNNSTVKLNPKEEKYRSSGLSEAQKEEIGATVRAAFETDRIYLDPDLTLNKLSDILGISRSYVSQVVNERFGASFTTLTNEYRVKESRRLLSSGEYSNYTVEAIGQMVGFNSRSSFNAAFKKFTGTTPSFFQRNVHRKINPDS